MVRPARGGERSVGRGSDAGRGHVVKQNLCVRAEKRNGTQRTEEAGIEGADEVRLKGIWDRVVRYPEEGWPVLGAGCQAVGGGGE